jgi:hypothetical protein
MDGNLTKQEVEKQNQFIKENQSCLEENKQE